MHEITQKKSRVRLCETHRSSHDAPLCLSISQKNPIIDVQRSRQLPGSLFADRPLAVFHLAEVMLGQPFLATTATDGDAAVPCNFR